MFLCSACDKHGFCIRKTTQIVTSHELSRRAFVYDVRSFGHSLNIPASMWLDTLTDWYRDYPGRILSPRGRETWLNMGVFEVPSIEDWFERTFSHRPTAETSVRLRPDTRNRLLVAATLLKAVHPLEARLWGVRAGANDNVRAATNDNGKI